MPDFKAQLDALVSRIAVLESADVPFHQHTGLDMAKVDYNNLQGIAAQGLVATITLTPAQVLTLKTTPVTIVPTPTLLASGGLQNTVIIVQDITAKNTFNSVAYTGANALEFRYTDGAGTKVTADMASTFINSASTAYDHVSGIITEFAPLVNKPIVVAVPVADPGAGNGNLTFVTRYRLISL